MTRQILLLALGMTVAGPASAQTRWSVWVGLGQSLANYDVTGAGPAGQTVRYDGSNSPINLTSLTIDVGAGPALTVEISGMLGLHDVAVTDSAPGTPASLIGRSGRLAAGAMRLAAELPLSSGGAALHLGAGPALIHRSGSGWSGLGGRTDLGASLVGALEFAAAGLHWRAGAEALLYQARLSAPGLIFPSRFHDDMSVSLSARLVHP